MQHMDSPQLQPTFSIIDVLNGRIADPCLKKAARTELRLMKSLAQLLDKQSFNDIRNSDICANADLSYGVLNARFKDKRALAIHLAEFYMVQLENSFQNSTNGTAQDADGYLKVFDQIYYHLNCAQNNIGIWRLLSESSLLGDDIEAIYQRTHNYWAKMLTDQLPERIGGKKTNAKEIELIGLSLSGMFDIVFIELLVKRRNGLDFPLETIAEWIALLRYRAIMGHDPDPESVKRARRLAEDGNE